MIKRYRVFDWRSLSSAHKTMTMSAITMEARVQHARAFPACIELSADTLAAVAVRVLTTRSAPARRVNAKNQ